MSPENAGKHRLPISELQRLLIARLSAQHRVMAEASLALPRLLKLNGEDVPPSHLDRPRAIEADLAIFDGVPRVAHAVGGEPQSFTTRGLRLVVEVLSKRTWGADLGSGEGDVVDRWASYHRSEVPELWVINAGVEGECPLPPMSGLFLRRDGDMWVSLEVASPAHAPGEVHGLRPLVAGVVRSGLGFELDVGALFSELAKVIAEAIRVDDAPPT